MNLLAKTGLLLAVVLAFAACTGYEASMEAKIEAQSKQIAEIQASLKALQQGKKDAGRFQVMNGTPALARNIMLVDTATGRTWLECESRGSGTVVSSNWCAMEMFGTPSAP